jgi:hypothetical protein
MNKLLPLIFALGILCVPSAQAMPVVPLGSPQAGLTIPVGWGWGFGVCRGLFYGCAPVYVYGGNYGKCYRGYRNAHYRGPYVRYHYNDGVVVSDRGICGFGSYLSCSHGTCWRRCY